MTSQPLLATLLLLSACGGGIMYTSTTVHPSAAPQDAFDCARSQLGPLGFAQSSYDVTDYRLTARKIDDKVTRPDRTFRRLLDRLIIEIHPGADGATAMKVEAHTFGEYETVRGPTEVEEPATDGVKAAAAALIQTCGQ